MDSGIEGGQLAGTIEFYSRRPLAGSLVIENNGNADVRLWHQGNSWGDSALSFQARVEGQSTRITKVLQDYTRNVPASISLHPGARHEFSFDLNDGSWQPASALAQLGQPGAELEAIYDSGNSPEVQQQGVWQGELRSGFVPLR